MKKFSNLDKKEKILSVQKPKINNIIENIVLENTHVVYNGDVDDVIDKKMSIEGIDEFVNKIKDLLEELKEKSIEQLSNELIKKLGNSHNQKIIVDIIKQLKKDLYTTKIPSPFEIFSENDYYIASEDTIVLKYLNEIPFEYLDYLNSKEVKDYFEDGNFIKIKFLGYDIGWEVSFVSKVDFGTPIDDEEEKFKKFLTSNKNFIADFLKATKDLVGSKHLILDKKFFLLN